MRPGRLTPGNCTTGPTKWSVSPSFDEADAMNAGKPDIWYQIATTKDTLQ